MSRLDKDSLTGQARRTLKRFHEEWVGLLAPPPTGPVAPPATSHLQQVG